MFMLAAVIESTIVYQSKLQRSNGNIIYPGDYRYCKYGFIIGFNTAAMSAEQIIDTKQSVNGMRTVIPAFWLITGDGQIIECIIENSVAHFHYIPHGVGAKVVRTELYAAEKSIMMAFDNTGSVGEAINLINQVFHFEATGLKQIPLDEIVANIRERGYIPFPVDVMCNNYISEYELRNSDNKSQVMDAFGDLLKKNKQE